MTYSDEVENLLNKIEIAISKEYDESIKKYKSEFIRLNAVIATCEDYTQVEIPFTEEGYDKHIKHMKPTLESPFKCVVNND